MKDLPNRIREFRKDLGWTLARLAEEIECSIPHASDLELGKAPLTQAWLRKIAEAMNVTPGELLMRSENPWLPEGRERELIERVRAMPPEKQDELLRIADAIAPYEAPKKADAA